MSLITGNKLNFMEVCGTHTMAIARNGLRPVFPKRINMISGPGCPVCVTPTEDIDKAIALSRKRDVIVATFGDMIKVPGSSSSLEKEKAGGADIRIIYSPMDALDIARQNPSKNVVLLGVGFETTSPGMAIAVKSARKEKIRNFYILTMFKTIPAALEAILKVRNRKIDGFLLPGHVSAVIGSKPYEFIAKKYKVPCVIGGFEAGDILKSVDMLLAQTEKHKPAVEIEYSSVVKELGNPQAKRALEEVFEKCDSAWRGIGGIPSSGLKLKGSFAAFDALKKFKIKTKKAKDPRGCRCGDVLLGILDPEGCSLFGKRCVPSNPVGPCMVSSEGACAAKYKYGRNTGKRIKN